MNKVNLILEKDTDVPCHLLHQDIEWIHNDVRENSLLWDGKQLMFLPPGINESPISFDFTTKLKYHASQQYNLKKELLAKALGITQQNSLRVVDGSMGTGKDSMLMLAFGAQVRGVERNPIVYALLKDACQLAEKGRDKKIISESLTIELGSALDISLNPDGQEEIFYFDPMFKKMRNKSKSKKEMEIFKHLVGSDSDYVEVLEWAFTKKFKRVVLKRSVHDEIYLSPTASYKGNTVRYDMYSFR